MRNINKEELNEILKEHELWLEGKGGEQADLRRANLRFVSLRGVDLRGADLSKVNLRHTDLNEVNLSNADLRGADLSDSNLSNANLRGADLRGANLGFANLRGTDLRDADLRRADLRFANLRDANLSDSNLKYTNLRYADLIYTDLKDVKTNIYTLGYNLACPEKGSFIGYKKAGGCVVKLLIPDDAKRSSATTVKCRCNKARVLEIENIKTGEKVKEIRSDYDNNFIYRVGEIVYVNNFDDDRWNECTSGIHFFMNRDNAIKY